jgi:hypothetical protein
MTMRSCAEKDQRETTLRFIIKISFSTNDNVKDSLNMTKSFVFFYYMCQFNNCNDELTENKIKKTINDHFDYSSMYKVFKTKLQEKQTTKPNIGSTNYSTRNESSGIFISAYEQRTSQPSMNILIFHTFLITISLN